MGFRAMFVIIKYLEKYFYFCEIKKGGKHEIKSVYRLLHNYKLFDVRSAVDNIDLMFSINCKSNENTRNKCTKKEIDDK